MGTKDDLHELANGAIGVRDELSVRTTLEDDTTPNICKLVEMFEVGNTVGNEDSSFGSKETLGTDDVVCGGWYQTLKFG